MPRTRLTKSTGLTVKETMFRCGLRGALSMKEGEVTRTTGQQHVVAPALARGTAAKGGVPTKSSTRVRVNWRFGTMFTVFHAIHPANSSNFQPHTVQRNYGHVNA